MPCIPEAGRLLLPYCIKRVRLPFLLGLCLTCGLLLGFLHQQDGYDDASAVAVFNVSHATQFRTFYLSLAQVRVSSRIFLSLTPHLHGPNALSFQHFITDTFIITSSVLYCFLSDFTPHLVKRAAIRTTRDVHKAEAEADHSTDTSDQTVALQRPRTLLASVPPPFSPHPDFPYRWVCATGTQALLSVCVHYPHSAGPCVPARPSDVSFSSFDNSSPFLLTFLTFLRSQSFFICSKGNTKNKNKNQSKQCFYLANRKQ